MESLLLDLRFAARSLRRRPVFAIVSILTIALSIGAATAMYGVVDGVLFRSLPYRDAGRLVWVWQTDEARRKQAVLAANWDRVPLDYTDFLVWRERQRSFSGVAVWSGFGAMMPGVNGPEQIVGTRVSPGLFELLGVAPILGRTFARGEDVVGGPRLLMLSFESWQTRFGGRPNIVGSTIRLDGNPYEVVGVLPEGFTLERGKPGAPFWIPAGQQDGDVGKRNRSFRAIGKLRPGVTPEQAIVETRQLLSTHDDAGQPKGVRVADFVREETRDVRSPMLMLLAAVGLLLLISCVNVATLLLGEASTRDVEMSARVALGASRWRIVRQLLTESVLLSFAGSALGAVLAWWSTRMIVALAPPKIPGILGVHVDGRVLLVTLVIATVTGLLFGLAPALTLSQSKPGILLRAGQSSRRSGSLQRLLIGIELAFCVVLLVGAGLLVRSLQKLSDVDPGFRTDHLLAVRVSLSEFWKDSVTTRRFLRDALTSAAAVPGVAAVTEASNMPFTGGSSSSPYLLAGEGEAERRAHKHEVQQRTVAANYFDVMGIPVVAGRSFDARDNGTTEPVAIISETAVRRDFANTSPIGQRVDYQGRWRTIVGVVRDTKFGKLSADDQPAIYTPSEQRLNMMDVIVRTKGDAVSLAPAVRKAVQIAGPTVAITDIQLIDDQVQRSFAEERFRTVLIASFGAIAALLVSVGVFGVTARAVSRRTREVGIRVALGATTGSIVGMIVRQTLAGASVGLGVGTIGAVATSRILAPYLFRVQPSDPLTYVGISTLLTAVAFVASWLPARRAGKVQPATVLRER